MLANGSMDSISDTSPPLLLLHFVVKVPKLYAVAQIYSWKWGEEYRNLGWFFWKSKVGVIRKAGNERQAKCKNCNFIIKQRKILLLFKKLQNNICCYSSEVLGTPSWSCYGIQVKKLLLYAILINWSRILPLILVALLTLCTLNLKCKRPLVMPQLPFYCDNGGQVLKRHWWWNWEGNLFTFIIYIIHSLPFSLGLKSGYTE